jgi:Domain of unknown function (DUF4389)
VDPHPVRLEGRFDSPSRWLWLVKLLLLIPHLLALFFLFIAFALLTIVAFFAILFTGRYPRGMFDFNVGVLRWAWRVFFYFFGALGTDRYPPFTTAVVPDYPANLEIDYPERLTRWLVLVKWVLAFPHYLIVSVFVGGGWWAASGGWDRDDEWHGGGRPGLIVVLVVFAAIALLFTTRYPRGIYDFVLGLNRWVYRVVAYVTLMTDVYPPFRLDQGGEEPRRVEPAAVMPEPPPA